MIQEIKFYYNVMKYGKNKGQTNTFKKRLKYILRNLAIYKYSKKLATFILNHPFLENEVYRYPSLCSKLHRPYLTNELSYDKKLNAIISSYETLDLTFPKEILTNLYSEGEIELCSLEGKNKHIYFSPRYIKRKQEKVHANYDEFWESIGGIEKDNLWSLPKKLERKSIEDIPAKKRAQYIKKFNLLDTLSEKIILLYNI